MVFCNKMIRRYTGRTLLKKALGLQHLKLPIIPISVESNMPPEFISMTLTPELDIPESVIDEVLPLQPEMDNETDFVIVSASEKGEGMGGGSPSHEKSRK